MSTSLNSFKSLQQLDVAGKTYHYFDLQAASAQIGDVSRLPKSLKVLLENLLRFEDDVSVKADDIKAIAAWLQSKSSKQEIQYRPARVLMQDFTGVPAVVDLAAMRQAMQKAGGDANKINPLSPVDLVIDHSVMIGKSERGPVACEAIADNQAVYLMAVGGSAYLVSKAIKSSKVLAFEELGMEAIYEFEVKDMPVTVAVDPTGKSVHAIAPKQWQAKIGILPVDA